MPTYQYACTVCSHELEAVQSFSDDPLSVCPECQGRLRKVFSAVGVVFKGSGFYRTDSRAADNGSKGEKDSKDEKDPTGGKESKGGKDSNGAKGSSEGSANGSGKTSSEGPSSTGSSESKSGKSGSKPAAATT